MRKLLCFVSLFAATAGWAATQRPVESLHDLPSKWTGVAGGFLTKVPASFTIERIRKVTREERSEGRLLVSYDVDASLVAGERSIRIKGINLYRFGPGRGSYEMTFIADDDLFLSSTATVRYDEASDTYYLRDVVRDGERRFSFSAPAKLR